MFTKCKQTRKLKNKQHSYSLGRDLSLDTHIVELLSFFQNVNKSLFMFMKCKQTRKLKEKTYSYSLGLDLSFDTYIDALVDFFKM
jgi:hypothetical protein